MNVRYIFALARFLLVLRVRRHEKRRKLAKWYGERASWRLPLVHTTQRTFHVRRTSDNQDSTKEASKSSVSRRALLKGTISAMPAVLTLQSGAAFARSSNLISASPRNHRDRWRRTLCLDLKSVYPVNGSRRLYDLGHPAYGRVGAIRDRDHVGVTRYGVRRVRESEMCTRGGTYYYRAGRNYGSRGLSESDIQQITQMHAGDTGQVTATSASGYYGGQDSYYGGQQSDWRRVTVHRGVLVSATALSSFSGNIVVKDL